MFTSASHTLLYQLSTPSSSIGLSNWDILRELFDLLLCYEIFLSNVLKELPTLSNANRNFDLEAKPVKQSKMQLQFYIYSSFSRLLHLLACLIFEKKMPEQILICFGILKMVSSYSMRINTTSNGHLYVWISLHYTLLVTWCSYTNISYLIYYQMFVICCTSATRFIFAKTSSGSYNVWTFPGYTCHYPSLFVVHTGRL